MLFLISAVFLCIATAVFALHCNPTGVNMLLAGVSRVRVEVRVRVAQLRVDGQNSQGPGWGAKKILAGWYTMY